MINYGSEETIDNLTVYSDDKEWDTFYVLPKIPSFRLDKDGKPVFLFVKYKTEMDSREGGYKAGGFAFFDVVLKSTKDELDSVKKQLQPRVDKIAADLKESSRQVKIANFQPFRGEVTVTLLENNNILQKVRNPSSPSLYGDFVVTVAVEFTKEGSTLFWDVMQAKRGGVVQVNYKLDTYFSLPPATAECHWDAKKFNSFFQTITTDEAWYGGDEGRNESIIEMCHNSEAYTYEWNLDSIENLDVRNEVRESIQRTFDDAVARNLLKASNPVADENRKLPDGLEHITRSMINANVGDVHVTYKEGMTMIWSPNPGGTLPNITTFDGIVLNDHFMEADIDDPFFKSLVVPVIVNADFDKLPIHSIHVYMEYNEGKRYTRDDMVLTSPNDMFKFATYIENNNWMYKYWYKVNYKNEVKIFESQKFETEDKSLTISVDDTGIIHITILPGDIDFSEIKQVWVTVQYEDRAAGIDSIEEVITLREDQKEAEIVRVIFQPVRNQYRYKVKYQMANGKKYEKDWANGQSNRLFIYSPFVDTRVIHLRSLGDMEQDIDNIYVELTYEDAANDYIKKESFALNKANPFTDWSIPVINNIGGKVTYSGEIKYKNVDMPEEIPLTEAKTDTIYLPPGGFLEVQILPDLIDFSIVKLAKVSLRYQDQENGINESKDIVFKPDSVDVNCMFRCKDENKKTYQWYATFFMKDGTKKKTDPIATDEPILLPEIPLEVPPIH
jgi:hypothetical protein